MRTTRFVDRVDDLRFISRHLTIDSNRCKVVILHGARGIGKSALARQVLRKAVHAASVKVSILDAKDRAGEDGLYVRRVAEELNRISSTAGFLSLSDFLQQQPVPEVRRVFGEINLAKLASGLHGQRAFDEVDKTSRAIGLGPYSASTLLSSDIPQASIMLRQYLQYALASVPIIVNVENMHAVDSASLNIFSVLSKGSLGSAFLFEFTEGVGPIPDVGDLARQFKNQRSRVVLRKLKKIPFTAFMEIVASHESHAKNILEKAFVELNGNLRSLLDLEVQIEMDCNIGDPSPATNDTLAPTFGNVESLDDHAKLLLACVVVHDGQVDLNLLARVAGNLPGPPIDLTAVLSLLEARALADISDTVIRAGHDQVLSIYGVDFFARFSLLATQAWLRVYEELYAEGDYDFLSKSSVLGNLFKFYSSIRPEKLLVVMPEIRKVANRSIRPEIALKYLEQLRAHLGKNMQVASPVFENVCFELLDCYYSAGLFDRAFHVLDGLPMENARVIVYLGCLLDRLDQHSEAIEYCEMMLNVLTFPDTSLGRELELSLRLILMASRRSIGDSDGARQEFENITQWSDLDDLQSSPYVYRNAEIVLGFKDSLGFLRQAVRSFEGKEMLVDAGRAQCSLSMNLARLGELDSASDILSQSTERLAQHALEQHVLLNNRAAIEMLGGSFGKKTQQLLDQAMMTARFSFEKIVILYNYLTVQVNQASSIDGVVENLCALLEEQPDPAIHRTAYYNMAQAYKRFDRGDAFLPFLRKARETADEHNSYWRYRLYGEGDISEDYRFLARHGFHVGFLSHWHFMPCKTLAQLRLGLPASLRTLCRGAQMQLRRSTMA